MSTLAAEQNLSWYRGFIQGKTRIILAWIFAFLLGWASGYLRKDSRPAIGGPYAFVRNPLYLGTYLMALGTIWAIENWILLGVITVLFAAIYHYIILDEEVKLRKMFKEPYLKYCQMVPRFFPKPWSFPAFYALSQVNPELSHHRFSWELAMKNKAYEAFLSFLGLMGFVTLIAHFWKHV
jgi:amino acid transporter